MVDITAEVMVGKGAAKHLNKDEMHFFVSDLSIRKAFSTLLIIWRMLQNKEASAIPLIFKGFLLARLGKAPPLSKDESERLIAAVIGGKPKIWIFSDGEVNLKVHNKPSAVHVLALIREIMVDNQYCVSREKVKDKILVDAGANIGIFSLYSTLLGAKRVYAFEPITGTCDALAENAALNGLKGKIIPMNMALGDKDADAKISYDFACDASASLHFFDPTKRVQMVKLRKIDSLADKLGAVSFIKIDAEGYEEKILTGARNTIKKYKPILVFSAYHLAGDQVRLPGVVKKIRNDYNCTCIKRSEEDIYCE